VALFTLSCDGCGFIDEYIFDAREENKQCPCVECGDTLSTKTHRLYLCDIPQITGDTVSKGMNWNYYDDALGIQIHGKQHRADEMEKRGLTDYNPDPVMKAHRDEARRIRENSVPSDADAQAAIAKEYKTATDKRHDRNIRASFDKSLKDIGL